MPIEQFFSYIFVRKIYIPRDDNDDVLFVLDQHTYIIIWIFIVLAHLFQILRNDVRDNINKFNLATVFVSIKCLYKKKDK
jgi:hypothetical protein